MVTSSLPDGLAMAWQIPSLLTEEAWRQHCRQRTWVLSRPMPYGMRKYPSLWPVILALSSPRERLARACLACAW
eukprot:5429681-Pyramimonas_sp.AAC.1